MQACLFHPFPFVIIVIRQVLLLLPHGKSLKNSLLALYLTPPPCGTYSHLGSLLLILFVSLTIRQVLLLLPHGKSLKNSLLALYLTPPPCGTYSHLGSLLLILFVSLTIRQWLYYFFKFYNALMRLKLPSGRRE